MCEKRRQYYRRVHAWTMTGQQCMAQMSEKFKAMGEQVYVDAEKVKEGE
jgi:hypothetical protein